MEQTTNTTRIDNSIKKDRTLNIEDPQKVFGSKRYIKGLVEYKAPEEILSPVLDKLRNTNLIVKLSGSNENKIGNTDGTKNVAFGRINIQATVEMTPGINYELGILFALDLAVPKCKIYRGPKVNVCLNLCIFGADDVVGFDMTADFNIETVILYLKEQAAKIKALQKTIEGMQKRIIKPDEVEKAVGNVFMRASEKQYRQVGANPITYGLDLLTDSKSRYYYRQPEFNQWLLYNAMTEYYNDKKTPLFEIPDKSFSTYELISSSLKK